MVFSGKRMPTLCTTAEKPSANDDAPGVGAAGPLPPRIAPVAVWLMVGLLGIIAACLVLRLDTPLSGQALAQPIAQAGARGVFAFTGQVTKNTFGVFMVDVDAGTIWCYEWNETKGCLKLLAARSWRYDRYLEQFNVGEPGPQEVERLVEMERAQRLQDAGSGEP
jgi:hypothetical protein